MQQTNEESVTIETKEIRGLNLRNTFGMIAIVVSVMGSYFSLKQDIADIRAATGGDAKINELQIKQLDLRIEQTNAQINALQQQVLRNSTRLRDQ